MRASAPNTAVSTTRCSSGQGSPGAVPLNALSPASRAGLNGNTNATVASTDFSVPETALAGTSATKATGSETRKASSEEALTSRAIPPSATPSAPKASPPKASASTQSSKRDQSRCTNSETKADISSVTTDAQPADSTTFSAKAAALVMAD